ncbi:MAG: DUF1232 domain-containing protein [Muribaculaceae bacterium]|nr:DUF1232 domain-containing protein [Muribaculaceae bacterium]
MIMENGVILKKFNENIQKYAADFSSGGLWEKLKKYAAKLGAKVVYTALKLYYVSLDPTISAADKLIITAALGYLILPIDLVPDWLPGGFIDDGLILAWALKQMQGVITNQAKQQAQAKLREWFPNVNVEELEA